MNGGRAANESEICGLLIAVIFAGQHTSSITTTWTGYHMIADKAKSYAAAIEEQKRVLKEHGEELDFDVLQVGPRPFSSDISMHLLAN